MPDYMDMDIKAGCMHENTGKYMFGWVAGISQKSRHQGIISVLNYGTSSDGAGVWQRGPVRTIGVMLVLAPGPSGADAPDG